jgi:outer membrane receptor protein involved in Fe transport
LRFEPKVGSPGDVQGKESVMWRCVGAFLAVCLTAALASAQETTGTIAGQVVDAQGLAVPGATVQITGPQGIRAVVTDANGRFAAPFLTPGAYDVRVELEGFKSVERQGVQVALGQTTAIPVTLDVGEVAETVNVTAASPVIDTTTTTSGASLPNTLLQQVPVGRTVSDTLYLAPGVSSSGTAGSANPSIGGGSGLDNQYVIDGVNVTNQGYGALGSYSIVFGSLGNATPFDFIDEVDVKTGGYEAEFGQSTGGVVNVITKSGSNLAQGSLFGYTHPDALQANWTQYQSINGSVQTEGARGVDGGAEGGLPIVRNKLFVFGAVDPAREVTTLQAPAGFPLLSLGNQDRVRRTVTYAAKGTWQPTSSQRIDASFFGDPATGDSGPQRASALLVTDTSSFSALKYGGHNQTVRYSGALRNGWLLEGSFGRALNHVAETPSVDTWRVTDQTVTPTVTSGGIGFYEANDDSVSRQFAAKATRQIGNHELRFGAEYDAVDYGQTNQRTGPTFTAADGRQTATGAQITILPDANFGQIYRVTRANFNTGRATTQGYGSLFVQDSWRAGNRLTINPGLRYEQERLSGTIVQDFTLKNNWAPRIGATYLLTSDAKTKLFGSYGIFYARIPNDLAARSLSVDDSTSRADYFDAALTQPIPNGVATTDPATGAEITNHYVLASVSPDTIDPNARLSYTSEYQIGLEREIAPETGLSVRYTNRRLGRILEDVANAPLVAYDLGVPGLDSVEYILTNPSHSTSILPDAAFLGASFDDPVHRYQAIEVTLDRRFSNKWSALASYRWSRLRGNFEGFYRDDNGQSDPAISSLYDFPTDDPSYAAIGVPQFGYRGDIRYLGQVGILPLDRPHQLKAAGNYLFPKGVNVGASLSVSSGAPLTPLASNPNYDNGGEIPEAPRGSGIQTVDGFKTRTPMLTDVDVQASYRLGLGGRRSLTLVADAFNLFNSQRPLTYDQWTELSFQVPNPDFGAPITQVLPGHPPQFQPPFEMRLGARLSF